MTTKSILSVLIPASIGFVFILALVKGTTLSSIILGCIAGLYLLILLEKIAG